MVEIHIPIVEEAKLIEFNDGDIPTPCSLPRYVVMHTANINISPEQLEEMRQRFAQILHNREREAFYGTWDITEESNKKAKKVLLEHLSPVQRYQYEREGYFHAIGSISRERYKIYPRRNWGISVMGYSLCATTQGKVPIEDEMLIHKLLIETNEKKFLDNCNYRTLLERDYIFFNLEERKNNVLRF